MVAALRVASSRDPLGIPFGLEDSTLGRFLLDLRDTIRGIQKRERSRVVALRYPSTTSSLAEEDAVPHVDRDLELVAAYWSQSTAVSASTSNYWTFYLRQGRVGAQQATTALGKVDSQDGISVNTRIGFSLQSPIVRAGQRVTFEVEETGVAGTLGPGVLLLVFREVD